MTRGLIVHPNDLGPASEGAFHHALRLGVAMQARLELVHVREAGDRDPEGQFPGVRDTLIRWGLLPAGATQAQVSEQLGLYVSKAAVAARDAEAGLVRLLRDADAQMLVLGTRALEGMRRLIDGSFSEQLARDARLPALFVPQGAAGFVDGATGDVRLKTVLIPVAKSADAAGAIATAARLTEVFGKPADFHLLHVGDEAGAPNVQAESHARRHDHVRQGPVVDTIVNLADELEADVIVMATAGHKGILDALRGSTTEEVMRKGRRALLAVPAN